MRRIVRFDDLDLVSCCMPTIASVRRFRDQTGLAAVQMILAQLRKQPVDPRSLDVGFERGVRQSTDRLARIGARPSLTQTLQPEDTHE